MKREPKALMVVTPDLFGRSGGIARIARAMVLALRAACQRKGWNLQVLALNDSGEERDERYTPADVDYNGMNGNRVALACKVLRQYVHGHVGTIFCHVNLASLGLLLPVFGRTRAKPYVVVAHGVDVWKRMKPHRQLALCRAAEVWAVSDYTANVVRDVQGVQGRKIKRLYNCLDPYWVDDTAVSIPLRPYMLTVARLARTERKKGVEHLVRAFQKVAGLLPDFDLYIAGDGDDLPRLKAMAAETSYAERIVFVGGVTDEELRGLYEACAFFALPSAKEGFGLVYLEAMAARKAVIAASCGPIPEVVKHEETGLLVPFGDEETLARAIFRLGANPELAARLGECGRARLEREFSFCAYRDRIVDAVESLWCQ